MFKPFTTALLSMCKTKILFILSFLLCISAYAQQKIVSSTYINPHLYPNKTTNGRFILDWDDFDHKMALDEKGIIAFDRDKKKGQNQSIIFNLSAGKILWYPGHKNTSDPVKEEQIKKRKAILQKRYATVLYKGARTGENDNVYLSQGRAAYGRAIDGRTSKEANLNAHTHFVKHLESFLSLGLHSKSLLYAYSEFGFPYAGKENLQLMTTSQVYNRHSHGPVLQLTAMRSATRKNGDLLKTRISGTTMFEKHQDGKLSVYQENDAIGSYALARRLYYYAWLNNTASLEYEIGLVYKNSKEKTPFGACIERAKQITDSIGRAGVMQTPIAVMRDFYTG